MPIDLGSAARRSTGQIVQWRCAAAAERSRQRYKHSELSGIRGARLARAPRRGEASRTWDDLGQKRTGKDRATIRRLENGQIDNPTIATMTRYAKALGKKVLVSLVEAGAGVEGLTD